MTTTFNLSEAEQEEVRAAARRAAGAPLAELTPESFPLPTAGALLQRLAGEVTGGAGFALLRGVPVDEDPDPVCAGVGCHVGRIVPQGPEKAPVQHVRDQGYQHWPPVISPLTVLGGLAGAVAIGIAAGVYPAIRASRLTPTQSLAAP